MFATPPLWREFQPFPYQRVCLNSINWIFSLIVMYFTAQLFFSMLQGKDYVSKSLKSIPPHCGCCAVGEVPSLTVSPSFMPFFMLSFYPSLCKRCSHSPQFFLKMNYSVYQYRSGMKVVGGGFDLFLCCHLSRILWKCFFLN